MNRLVIICAIISLCYSLSGAAFQEYPDVLGNLAWATMFWALSWVVVWGDQHYARIRRKNH